MHPDGPQQATIDYIKRTCGFTVGSGGLIMRAAQIDNGKIFRRPGALRLQTVIGSGRQAYTFVSLVVLLTVTATAPSARPEFLAAFKATYPILKPGGVIDSASCNLCHKDGPPKLNPYGSTIKSAMDKANAQNLSASMLHSVESIDSDGDGFSNLEEINADTLPGDPTSHPAGKPLSSAKAPSQADSGEVSPFDIKAIIFAKHAQHPVIIHLPIGLFIASLLFDLISRSKKSPGLNTAAYYNLILAALTGVISVITGIIAWQWKFAGATLRGNLLLHLILGVVTCLLMFVLWAMRRKCTVLPADQVSTAYLALAIITGLVIALTGHVGGILSGVV
jgi:uncharacterized membrane protein